MVFCDTHSHLYFEHFFKDIDEVIQRCITENVKYIFLPNVDVETIALLKNLKAKQPNLFYPMMGLHPCSVDENYLNTLNLIKHELYTNRHFYCGVGEIGLDFYWDKTFTQAQYEALNLQIDWALELNLPIVLHCRESFDETFEIVQKKHNGSLRGIFHCFSGSMADAEKVLSLPGFFLGIGGVATYKKSNLPDIISKIPLQRILLETDSPYLAPEPYRSSKNKNEKRNESSYIPIIAQTVAQAQNCSLQQVAQITTANALNLFAVN
ncbi:MAG: TatD family hydrolase [Sphingobacteriales bacterium]|jgi:TatD DNase family protein|nr:TatD family hydrolase [Sphingobacteriales bacterium]MBP9140218.1 TatD family hydrolase [Chitinophagales bacterium]MDA0197648.1 TatD family hydrolase [Bacteroidota bacterium]MBK6888993.1 TatD family hydrolase [Sphingobacteriales bacterium]MBK7528505.1 TatD family hydrolase [Sphingobacteriales bacterium]